MPACSRRSRRLSAEASVAIGYLVAAASVILILNSPYVAQEKHEVDTLLFGNAVGGAPDRAGAAGGDGFRDHRPVLSAGSDVTPQGEGSGDQ